MSYQQGYPGGVSGPPGPRSTPPSVLNAVKLMYLGAGLSALSMVVSLATIDNTQANLRGIFPGLGGAALNARVNALVGLLVVTGLIGVGLWIWMAWANKKGLAWARVTGTVFFGLNTLGLLDVLVAQATIASKAVGVVIFFLGLGAVLLLWRPESGPYFGSSQGAPTWGYPPEPRYPPPAGGQWHPPSR